MIYCDLQMASQVGTAESQCESLRSFSAINRDSPKHMHFVLLWKLINFFYLRAYRCGRRNTGSRDNHHVALR